METVVFDQTPLAEYLRDEGEEQQHNWVPIDSGSDRSRSRSPSPSPSSPSPSFAPKGRPTLKTNFRNRLPNAIHPLQINVPEETSSNAPFKKLQRTYSVGHDDFSLEEAVVRERAREETDPLPQNAVTARIDPADNSKFLEQFRYTIVASQLLSSHALLGQQPHLPNGPGSPNVRKGLEEISTTGVWFAVAGACAVAWFASWIHQGGVAALTRKRSAFLVVFAALMLILLISHAKRQRLRYLRDQALMELSSFVSTSQDFDSATAAAVGLIQEVELVSRGYRLSTPLPPVSRLDDNGQSRRCVRLRKALIACFNEVIPKYQQTCNVVKGLAEQLDLEKYYDIYDISDFDLQDAQEGLSNADKEEAESLRVIKIVAARFHTMRKIFLCALLALEVNGDESDYLRWHTALEGMRSMLTPATKTAYSKIARILGEETTFQAPPTPKMPLTPGREKWRSQLRNLNSLSTGIRGLQAKLHLLHEESDHTLNEADSSVSQLGSNLMSQYESIGVDLKALMQAWDEGKAALASGIDRHEKRLSSMSALMSPTSSLSGLTTVDESGGTLEALKALNGESSPPTMSLSSPSEPDMEQVFEAVAGTRARPRSMLTREERIAKMREEREHKATARQTMDASRGMLRELEMVINLRPKSKRNTPARVSL